ncbi:acetyl-CoA hydrolase/transferase family protein [Ruixingdingia sedimenti]|uniref:Acetyl-CoA hydrolase/transferase C-terminal domain-containing protein n=1 Tax=Ruixingdingia sedimenti TaxID=3073604 RepID=A0ABU1F8T9_9RHOB|nr:acetyl-CoA hydrolase/transferase C-terminal domain-containing protein [Xinfangfangia sp. LG-4]MDR5653299.1 acetyl-CoA hydrolase/transferase C-terminal domain-containing protein [Xinfangfangia sp. LG-4]
MAQQVDLSRLIRPGDTLMWGQSQAEPQMLLRLLAEQRHAFARVRAFTGIGLSGLMRPEHADAIDFFSYCGGGTSRALARAGVLDILPVHYAQLPRLVRAGALRVDVLLLQVSPPDDQGRYSLGMAREYLVEPLSRARVVIGEVHPDVPWTHGGPYLRREDFALLVDSDAATPADAPVRIGPVEEAIGRHVAALVEDGATIQTGVGAVPDAALAQLADRRDLGVHSGSIGDGVARLQAAGVITNARKSIDPGVTIGGVLLGGSVLRRFVHRNPAVEMRGTEYTHDPRVLAQISNFVALNSAVEVDLTGQINSEVAGGTYVGGVGGIVDFLRAAGFSDGGVPIVALPATAGAASRIVPRLTGPVTVPRSDACVIVTEYGVADLRGLTLAERIPRMIAVAHPDHREALARAAHGQGG